MIRHTLSICTILAVVASAALIASSAHATTLLFDDFDDGNVGTNTSGTGTGFAVGNTNGTGSVSESAANSRSEFRATGNTAVRAIVSNDTFDPDGISVRWSFDSNDIAGRRVYAFLTPDVAADWVPVFLGGSLRTTDQIQVRMRDSNTFRLVFGEDVGQESLYVDVSDAAINYSNPFDVLLDVDSTGYTLSVEQSASTVLGPFTGNWSDTPVSGISRNFADILDTNGELRVGAGLNGAFETNSRMRLGSIEVIATATSTGTPEPSALLLAVLGLVGLACRGRRRG